MYVIEVSKGNGNSVGLVSEHAKHDEQYWFRIVRYVTLILAVAMVIVFIMAVSVIDKTVKAINLLSVHKDIMYCHILKLR